MNGITRKSEYLLDEIGQIDDELLFEAMTVKRKRRPYIPAIIAAALTTWLVIILSAALVLNIVIPSFDKSNGDGGNVDNGLTEGTYSDLDSLMSSYKGGDFTVLEEEEIPYHTGQTYIVWQYEGEREYYMSKPLEAYEIKLISQDFGEGSQVGENGADLECKVWIILSDGSVKSPYLKNTDGNTGASVFDYNAEIYPTEDFVNNVSAIID